MTRKRNPGVVFSGTYKSALRRPSPRKFCTPRSKPRKTLGAKLIGGPMDGHILAMTDHSCTLPITMSGQTGRYVSNKWQPA